MLIKAFQLMNPSPSERKATKLKKTVTQHCKMNLKSSNKHFRYEKKKSPEAEIWKPRAEIRKLRTEMSKQTTIRKRKKRIRVDWTQIRNRTGTQAFFKHTVRAAPLPQQQSPEEKEELPGKGVNMLVAQLVDGWTLNNPCPLADRASSPRTSMDNQTKAYWFHLQRWGGSNNPGRTCFGYRWTRFRTQALPFTKAVLSNYF